METKSRNREVLRRFYYRGLGPCTREREEARAGATAEDDGGHGVRADVPSRSRSRRRRLGARVRLLLLPQATTRKCDRPALPRNGTARNTDRATLDTSVVAQALGGA